jgi:hypothetical protein
LVTEHARSLGLLFTGPVQAQQHVADFTRACPPLHPCLMAADWCLLFCACRTTLAAAAVATVAVEGAMVVAVAMGAAAAVMVAVAGTTGVAAMITVAVVMTGTASAGAAQHQAAVGAALAAGAGAGKPAWRGGHGTAGVMLVCSAATPAQHMAGSEVWRIRVWQHSLGGVDRDTAELGQHMCCWYVACSHPHAAACVALTSTCFTVRCGS